VRDFYITIDEDFMDTCVKALVPVYVCMYVCRLRVCNVNPSSPVVLCVTIPERFNAFPSNVTSAGVDRSQFSLKLDKSRR